MSYPTNLEISTFSIPVLLLSLVLAVPGYAQDTAPSLYVAVDSAGAIHWAGAYVGRMALGDTVFTAPTEDDLNVFMAKFDADGAVQWARQFGTADFADDDILGLVVDRAGHGYVSGVVSNGV